jgi:hypothetical protein
VNTFEYNMARDILMDILVQTRMRMREYELSGNEEEALALRKVGEHMAYTIQFLIDELREYERGG